MVSFKISFSIIQQFYNSCRLNTIAILVFLGSAVLDELKKVSIIEAEEDSPTDNGPINKLKTVME